MTHAKYAAKAAMSSARGPSFFWTLLLNFHEIMLNCALTRIKGRQINAPFYQIADLLAIRVAWRSCAVQIGKNHLGIDPKSLLENLQCPFY